MVKTRPLMKNKLFGALLMIIGVLAVGVIIMRVCCYQFEYVPGHYEVDYGRFSFFAYFTVQSNLYVCFYLITLSLAVFGVEKAKRIAFSPMVRLTVTTYIIVTGAVYCGGIPIGMTPPLYWDGFQHLMLSSVQVLHHMIMPPFIFILFLLPPTDKRIELKKIPLVGIYPLVYSLFSIARGALSKQHFYVYPFYRPEFFWQLFLKNREMDLFKAYLLMLPMLLCGICVFLVLAFLLALLNNRLVKK